jgi:hypothetical protein
MGEWSHSFAIADLDTSQRCQLHGLAVLLPRERVPCSYLIGGWVGPGTGLDAVK